MKVRVFDWSQELAMRTLPVAVAAPPRFCAFDGRRFTVAEGQPVPAFCGPVCTSAAQRQAHRRLTTPTTRSNQS